MKKSNSSERVVQFHVKPEKGEDKEGHSSSGFITYHLQVTSLDEEKAATFLLLFLYCR